MTADGVLPDRISRNPDAQSWLVFVDLQAGTDVRTWLTTVATTAVEALTGTGNAVCTTAFGSTLFDKAGTAAQRPLGRIVQDRMRHPRMNTHRRSPS